LDVIKHVVPLLGAQQKETEIQQLDRWALAYAEWLMKHARTRAVAMEGFFAFPIIRTISNLLAFFVIFFTEDVRYSIYKQMLLDDEITEEEREGPMSQWRILMHYRRMQQGRTSLVSVYQTPRDRCTAISVEMSVVSIDRCPSRGPTYCDTVDVLLATRASQSFLLDVRPTRALRSDGLRISSPCSILAEVAFETLRSRVVGLLLDELVMEEDEFFTAHEGTR
jgi:hypothetical protein